MLILICGLPRAGKTTYSKQFQNVIHLDTSGAYQGVIRKLKYLNGNIVIEGVYQRIFDRIKLIQSYNTDKYKCIWLDTSDKIRQSRQGWDKWCDQPFEPPTYQEGWDQIIIIKDNNKEIKLQNKGEK